VLKINGKTTIPSDTDAFSALTGTVEDAVRLGADAIGYTLYVGSPSQDRDIAQFMEVRMEADRYGMPIIMWAYPRGEAIEKKGGKDSLYAVDYAARVACELGADVVKINIPSDGQKANQPGEYKTMAFSPEEAIRKVVVSAGKTMVLFSGGSKVGDDDLLAKARMAMDNGATGLIFGRNMWQRPMPQALAISRRVTELMQQFSAPC
jgi:class I fructose-bisphosphate aldolase